MSSGVSTFATVAVATYIASLASAATLTVDLTGGGDYSDIQSALDAAATGDVVLLTDGIYRGPRNTNLHVTASDITLVSANGPELTKIDCEQQVGVTLTPQFPFTETRFATIRNISLTNATTAIAANWPWYVSIEGCNISDCAFGVALSFDSAADITGCIIELCSNAGILATEFHTDITAKDTIIRHNNTGIYAIDCGLVVEACFVNNNSTGIIAAEGGTLVDRCIVDSNRIGFHGAGSFGPHIRACIFSNSQQHAIISSSGSPTYIENCTIMNNDAEYAVFGGDSSPISLESCAVINNSGVALGGEILALSNCTVAGNWGAAIVPYAWWTLGYHTSIHNCIIFHNASLFEFIEGEGSASATYSCLQGGWPGEGNIDADPMFRDPLLGDYRLRARSPAVDSGTGAGAPSPDLDGNPRPLGAGVDMGAYEMGASLEAPLIDPDDCRVAVPVYLYSPEEVRGLTFGMRHDGDAALLKEILPGPACSECECSHVFPQIDVACDGEGTGGSLGLIFSLACTLPPGLHEVASFVYLARREGSMALELVGCLGDPPLPLEVTSAHGALFPSVSHGEVSFPYSCYIPARGDADASGSIGITDIIWILLCLFGVEPDKCADCLDVADVNDDGSFDILDPVLLIDYLFRVGAEPAAPFPGCGFDMTEDALPGCIGIPCDG